MAEKWALNKAEYHGLYNRYNELRDKGYVLMNLAKAYARKLNIANIKPDISTWDGNYVFISGWGSGIFEIKKTKTQLIN